MEAQKGTPVPSPPSPVEDPRRSNRYWAHPRRSTRTTSKSYVPPPNQSAAADKIAVTTRTPDRHKSSPCLRAAPASRSPRPTASKKDTDQIPPAQNAPPPGKPPVPLPKPMSQNNAAGTRAE